MPAESHPRRALKQTGGIRKTQSCFRMINTKAFFLIKRDALQIHEVASTQKGPAEQIRRAQSNRVKST